MDHLALLRSKSGQILEHHHYWDRAANYCNEPLANSICERLAKSSRSKSVALGSAARFVPWQTELSAASKPPLRRLCSTLPGQLPQRPKPSPLKFRRRNVLFWHRHRSRSISLPGFEPCGWIARVRNRVNVLVFVRSCARRRCNVTFTCRSHDRGAWHKIPAQHMIANCRDSSRHRNALPPSLTD